MSDFLFKYKKVNELYYCEFFYAIKNKHLVKTKTKGCSSSSQF